MPAIGTSAALARTRSIRLIGLTLALLFVASLGAAYATPVEAKDWTPQIQTTRRAQIYWETIMRSADAELRRLKKSTKQTQRKLKSVKANLRSAVEKRATAKKRLKGTKVELSSARRQLKAAVEEAPPPPEAIVALRSLVQPPLLAVAPTIPATTVAAPGVDTAATTAVEPAAAGAPADEKIVKQLERKVKKAKRDFKAAKRKAKRTVRSARTVQNRLTSLKAATRSATSRRESAERSLGAWILAMTKYGRIRATKKSDARPGVTSSFGWPVRGSISQYFHAGHDGIDIVRYKGAPVKSMAFGVVTYVGWNPWDQHGRAFMIVVTHAGGYETLYGHLQPKRVVRVGEEVRKGQVIGYMGNTGNSTGPHLHLELRRGRTTLNPMGVH